jgi:hypothetical protein
MARSLTVAYPKISPPRPGLLMRYGPTVSSATPARSAAPATAGSSNSGGSQATRCNPADTPAGSAHGRCLASASSSASRRRRYTGRIRRRCRSSSPRVTKSASAICSSAGEPRSAAILAAATGPVSRAGSTSQPSRSPGASVLLADPA